MSVVPADFIIAVIRKSTIDTKSRFRVKIEIVFPDVTKFLFGAGECENVISEVWDLKVSSEGDQLRMSLIDVTDPESLAGISDLMHVKEIYSAGDHIIFEVRAYSS